MVQNIYHWIGTRDSSKAVEPRTRLRAKLKDAMSSISHLKHIHFELLELKHVIQLAEIDGVKVICCTDEENLEGPAPYDGDVCFNIEIPPFDRYMTRRCMGLTRSRTSPPEKTCGKRYKEQLNTATSFLDASQVYGSSDDKQASLRDFTGGLLDVKYNEMLPETADSSTCFPITPQDYCLNAGDPRVNEHPGLSVLHTAFMREHNRIAKELATINPQWDDEKLYQESRKIVAAVNQRISYWEWLPLLLGRETMEFFELGLEESFEYRPQTNPTAFNAFPTAAFRYGHSQIPNDWTIGRSHEVSLDVMFMRPYFLLYDNGTGYDGLFSGMLKDTAQNVDLKFSKGITDHLFEKNGSLPLDLVSLNIQRGRDHALPPYVAYRDRCSWLTGKTSQIPSEGFSRINQVYQSFQDVDLFTGALAEYHLPGAQVGPTFACLIGLYFHRIKFGDRFWHQTRDKNVGFTQAQYMELTKVTFARVICDTSYVNSTQAYVFEAISESNPVVSCDEIPSMDLSKWKE